MPQALPDKHHQKFNYQRNALCWLAVKFEREKFYSGPGIEPGPLALCAIVLLLRHPGQLLIQVELISLSGRKHKIFFHYWSFKYMNAYLYMSQSLWS